ncbi:hypothetical protein [Nocardioides coralli]|uniref:hypothetical protein n=1 Tax=Nocardioides coralli TaxID=2872154 RepID=UPI001CA39AAB|nr:hypothetical protein [Nocardioides coralli]QZY29865.1 hypothetical protein K6T13_04025 [Nocardioides coralli]
MWTQINQTYATHHGQNAWGNLAANSTGWRKIGPNAPDGVTNVFLMLVAAKASNKQAYVVQDSNNQITAAYF